MLRSLLFSCCLLLSALAMGGTIYVKDIAALNAANKDAKPGDIIVLKNGSWNDVTIALNCSGTKESPISFRAETAGKVLISGHSSLKLGGNYIVVDGWYFVNGYAGDNSVIDFRIDKKQLANNCRVTNTVINDFNNPKRMDENYWVSFSGKNNRIDHCSFLNKKNMGVLVAVILDDDRSRENFHSIDHNYFGVRLPLASNSGEIIRVGVSQHALFNSNTQITDNFFEHCDGETEIVSIKSCSNVVRNNLFDECQGGVVLRHGNYNTVENNVFFGNGKSGTGGVRIINKGQWVVNNLFYECRGTGFRSPLSLMNGVPNSPPIRYVEVSEAVVMNNTFIDCAPISLGEGSDTERTVAPHNVVFENNSFVNKKDAKIYNAYDDISGITFVSNVADVVVAQKLVNGFDKVSIVSRGLTLSEEDKVMIQTGKTAFVNDSIVALSKTRLKEQLPSEIGFGTQKTYSHIIDTKMDCGAKWFSKIISPKISTINITAANGDDLQKKLIQYAGKKINLTLTGSSYSITEPVLIDGFVTLTSNKKTVNFNSELDNIFEIKGGSTLELKNVAADLSGIGAGKTFISSDKKGSSNHSVFTISNSSVKNLSGDFFFGQKSTMLDSIVISNSSFTNNSGTLFNFNNETDKKGYYNVEKIKFINNDFTGNKGQLLGLLRGGNDESTMGPLLNFTDNKITDCNSGDQPLIKLYGVQVSFISNNKFTNSSKDTILLQYEDAVRAAHLLGSNKIIGSGKIITDKFVEEKK